MTEAFIVAGACPASLETEVWVKVDGFKEHYEVSNLGRVRSVKRTIIDSLGRSRVWPGRTLGLTDHHDCMMAKLQLNMAVVYITAGSLVLKAFRGPAEGRVAIHLDSNYRNCRLDNLKWGQRDELPCMVRRRQLRKPLVAEFTK